MFLKCIIGRKKIKNHAVARSPLNEKLLSTSHKITNSRERIRSKIYYNFDADSRNISLIQYRSTSDRLKQTITGTTLSKLASEATSRTTPGLPTRRCTWALGWGVVATTKNRGPCRQYSRYSRIVFRLMGIGVV